MNETPSLNSWSTVFVEAFHLYYWFQWFRWNHCYLLLQSLVFCAIETFCFHETIDEQMESMEPTGLLKQMAQQKMEESKC